MHGHFCAIQRAIVPVADSSGWTLDCYNPEKWFIQSVSRQKDFANPIFPRPQFAAETRRDQIIFTALFESDERNWRHSIFRLRMNANEFKRFRFPNRNGCQNCFGRRLVQLRLIQAEQFRVELIFIGMLYNFLRINGFRDGGRSVCGLSPDSSPVFSFELCDGLVARSVRRGAGPFLWI